MSVLCSFQWDQLCWRWRRHVVITRVCESTWTEYWIAFTPHAQWWGGIWCALDIRLNCFLMVCLRMRHTGIFAHCFSSCFRVRIYSVILNQGAGAHWRASADFYILEYIYIRAARWFKIIWNKIKLKTLKNLILICNLSKTVMFIFYSQGFRSLNLTFYN